MLNVPVHTGSKLKVSEPFFMLYTTTVCDFQMGTWWSWRSDAHVPVPF
uniref:Uncharacterized protein n=1 Tax=Anguilla anguilla TaxID=7936 RepID=A0A0E9QIH3_ANGAN